MLRKKLKIAAGLMVLTLLTAVGLVARANWVLEQSYAHVPEPAIVADPSPAAVARGEMLFQSLCMECHGGSDGRATGKQLHDIPSFLGTFWSANLAHPRHGVLQRTDGQLARVLRSGVLPDGRLSVVMNSFGALGDADIAAILGYMRSGAPAFAPAGAAQPRSEPTLVGTLIVTYVAKVSAEGRPAHLPVPARAPTVEYGRYMAQVMDCVGCHTAGFSADKLHDPHAFAGGFELKDPTGTPIFTKNITFHETTGIGRWSLEDFERAVTRGVRPDGYLVRKPMPLFSRLDHTDVEALYRFLSTVPRVERANTPGGHPLRKVQANDTPERMFVDLGCAACHGETGPYRDKLLGALSRSESDVASWILDPQSLKPGTAMPSFAGAIDRKQAEQLARYVRGLARKRGS
jgi:mono/diheme cytochrome c family protein